MTSASAPRPEDVQATMCATLVRSWVGAGLRRAFVAPGSRSTPMALALAADPHVHTVMFHDERSAAFAALGSALASGVPAVALCTSGTAATHFLAAVVEAHQSAVPLILLTADRPGELHGVGAPQTIDQVRLYGSATRWFVDVPPAEVSGRLAWPGLAAAVWRRAMGTTPGPVHVNLRFREPLVGRPVTTWADDDARHAAWSPESPPWDPGGDSADADLADDGLADDDLADVGGVRGVIIAGHGVDDPPAVAELAAATNWPVLADARSGCRGLDAAVVAFDAVLRHPGFAADHRPQVVVQLGMPPASKVLGQWLAAAPDCRHLAVSPWGLISDPNLVGAVQIQAPVGQWSRAAAVRWRGAPGTPWQQRWTRAGQLAQQVFAAELADQWCEPAVARHLSRLSTEHHLVVSSSMPVRDLEWFGAPGRGPVVHANRGANGIDGVLATAIGVAVTGVRTVALLGDVAMLHDSSSLAGLAGRDVDLTVVIVDNRGGGIFSFLPQAEMLGHDRFEMLFGTPHATDLVALAAAHGLPATAVGSAGELDRVLAGSGPRLAVVTTDRDHNVTVHRALHDAVVSAMDARSR